MNVSFFGFNESSITFTADESVISGAPVKVSDNGTVTACAVNDDFCGVATDVRGGCATVQMSGYVKMNYSGNAPSLGYTGLAAGADGTVCANEGGRVHLVTDLDKTTSTVGFML